MVADYAIKDLRLIGRDLKSTIIVDNLVKNFEETTPDNGIQIEDFTGSFEDNHLYLLKNFLLKHVIADQIDDVRTIFKNQRELKGNFKCYL